MVSVTGIKSIVNPAGKHAKPETRRLPVYYNFSNVFFYNPKRVCFYV